MIRDESTCVLDLQEGHEIVLLTHLEETGHQEHPESDPQVESLEISLQGKQLPDSSFPANENQKNKRRISTLALICR